jgi:putative transposase
MARPPRIEVPGGIYHVGSRGNRESRIYADDHERETFLAMFGRLSKRYAWKLGTYVLMSNHYHLLMEIEEGLSDGMCELNGSFARYTNVRNGLDGHLFGKRFWCRLIEDESHYFQTARYIVLNPVRAGICASPEDWRWSSYRACIGLEFSPSFLKADELLRCFGTSPAAARKGFRHFVNDGLDDARGGTCPGARHRDGRRTR